MKTLLVFASIAAVASAHANLIVNGSFEDNVGLPNGWTVTAVGSVVAVPGSAYNGIGATGTAPYGPNFLAFNGGNTPVPNTIAQTFGTVAGTTYTLSFAYGLYGSPNASQELTFGLTGAGGLALAQSFTPAGTTDLGSIFQTYTVSFVATGSNATLTFTDGGNTVNADLFVDNVSVASVVPGPVAALPMALGFAVKLRRRRRA